MIELVFLACLQADPAACSEKVIKFMPAQVTAMCMMQAQPELAAWSNSHPDQKIARWKCRDMSRELAARNDPGARPAMLAP